MASYIPSIGMEVHAELATRSKMFCRCEVAFGGEPNTRTCPICLGLPGTLPVPNRRAIEMVIRTALALNCKIAMRSVFHRKNYFYPDLPKGYQVTQYGETNPLGYQGYLDIGTKRIRIRRVHLEEDTGKLMHLGTGESGVDYNRAGTPLMEIVTDYPPDIENEEEAKEYLVQLRQILLYLGVCDGKMEEGSLRCEPNVSVRLAGSDELGTKTELKNLNSFRSVQMGSAYEIKRQVAILEEGGKVQQETRGWNEQQEASYLMRVKEEENDYRYFPDPDLIPMCFDEAYIESLRAGLPELPLAKQRRYREQLGLGEYEAGWITTDVEWVAFFEEALAGGGEAKAITNWMTSDLSKLLNGAGISVGQSKVSPGHLVDLVRLQENGTISGKMAKALLGDVFNTGKMPSELVEEQGASQINDEATIRVVVAEVLGENEETVAKFKGGNLGSRGFLVGLVLKKTQGRANPQLVQKIVGEALE
ncbi:MAG: Asp-tRNA(Asn)/Glu-tRNA(Gln) amidotransferase subunit GatB [Fimbriimonas sp.]